MAGRLSVYLHDSECQKFQNKRLDGMSDTSGVDDVMGKWMNMNLPQEMLIGEQWGKL